MILWPFNPCLALLLLPLVSHSFTLKGNDLGRVESWLALLYLSAWSFNFRADRDFLCGLRLLEMPCFKGFCVLASIK